MEGLVKPAIEIIESDDTHGKFSLAPLDRGLGMTLGNSLRRVLLSSIEGAAITWVKIDGIQHEYSTIPDMLEDVTDFLLNVKTIRFRPHTDRPARLVLDVKGEGVVTAGDISPSADYEVVNPELHLAVLNSEGAHLSVEFNVERGKGYLLAGNTDGLPLGALPVDAIFSPIRRVNFNVEQIRVGQTTNKERLVLDVWTDGTLAPVEAVRLAGQQLVEQFFIFANVGKMLEQGPDKRPLALSIPLEQYNISVESLGLSARTMNCLKRASINKVGEVLETNREELLAIKNFGEKSLNELYDALRANGLLPMEEKNPSQEEEASADESWEEAEEEVSLRDSAN